MAARSALSCIARWSMAGALAWFVQMPGLAQTPEIQPPDAAGSQGGTTPTVRARCEPCTIEVGKTTTITAEAQGSSGVTLTYKWSAPTGTFEDATARQTQWTAPMRRGWSEERWQKEGPNGVEVTVTVDDGRGGTASDSVKVIVTKAGRRSESRPSP